MTKKVKCEDCLYSYTHSKKTPSGIGKYTTDFVHTLRCRKGHRILMGGVPSCLDLFEPK